MGDSSRWEMNDSPGPLLPGDALGQATMDRSTMRYSHLYITTNIATLNSVSMTTGGDLTLRTANP